MKSFRTIKEIDTLKNSEAYAKLSPAERANVDAQREVLDAKNIIRSINKTIESGYRKFKGHNTASRDILRSAAVRLGEQSIKTSSMYVGGINIPQISVSKANIKSIMKEYGNDTFAKLKASMRDDKGEYKPMYNYNKKFNEYFDNAKAGIEADIMTNTQGPIPVNSTYLELVEKTLKTVKQSDIIDTIPEVMKAKAILDDFSANYEKLKKLLKDMDNGEVSAEATDLMISMNRNKIRHLFNQGKFAEYNEKLKKIYDAVGIDIDRVLEWDYNEELEKDKLYGTEMHGVKLKELRKMFNA